MNQAARRIGRTLAFVLPVVLVLSGTLAVATVPWASPSTDSQLLTTATSEQAVGKASSRAPQDVLRARLLAVLREKDPGVALTQLQRELTRRPSLGKYCASIARSLGRAAVAKYDSAARAQAYSRPACDTSFASGVASAQ